MTVKKNSKTTSKFTPQRIESMKILRANGCTYDQIEEVTGASAGSISKYCKDVKMLPKHLRKNPFTEIQKQASRETFHLRTPTYNNLVKEGYIKDIDVAIDTYELGTRFLGPLDKISLVDLQKLMKEPTDYHSPLSMRDWADHYLGGKQGRFLKYKPYKWSNIQYEIFDAWEEHKKVMVKTHRDAGKTMAGDGIITHEICENRENNYFIMSETRQKAGFRVKHVADILLTNKRIIADYGFLPHVRKYEGHTQSWKQDQITVKREIKQTDPTLMAFSSESTVATGAHFNGGIFDDVWSFKLEQNSARNKEKWLGWYDGELEGCLEDAWELWLLTRKGPTDLYQDIEDRQFHVIYKRPAVVKFPTSYEYLYKDVEGQKVFDRVAIYSKDGEISDSCNGRFSMEFFLEKKLKMAADKWESEYQLNPMAAAGIYWKKADLRYFNGIHDFRRRIISKHYTVIGFMDLAFGKSGRADYTALDIIGLWEGNYYFLECYIKRGATKKNMVKMFRDACDTFHELRTIYVEADLQQGATVTELKEMAKFVSIQPFLSRQEESLMRKQDSARRIQLDGKPLRIWTQLESIIEDHKLWINKYMRNMKEFMDEYKTFPLCEHFDVLDALGNGCSVIKKKGGRFFIWSGGPRRGFGI